MHTLRVLHITNGVGVRSVCLFFVGFLRAKSNGQADDRHPAFLFYRSTEKVYKEFMLYAIGRNINKYHRFLHDKIHKFEGKTGEGAA